MTSKSQFPAHDIHGLAPSKSSAGGFPQWPTPISIVLPCFIRPPFTCKFSSLSAAHISKHTDATGEVFSSASPLLPPAGVHLAEEAQNR